MRFPIFIILFVIFLFSFQLGKGQRVFENEQLHWINFDWADEDAKDVMLITAKLDTLNYFFRWQLDTGSPYTYLEGGTFAKFATKFPYLNDMIKRADTLQNGNWYRIYTPAFKFENAILPGTILKNDKIGGNFPTAFLDQYKGFSIGTIGIDNFRNKVLVLDFKNKKIGWGDKLSEQFYNEQRNVSSFHVFKNRIIIPVQIGRKLIPFMYDCGASMFTLNATPKNASSFMPKSFTDTLYNINNGESGGVYNAVGGKIQKKVSLLGKTYKNIVVYIEKDESPIFDEAKVAGAIGNKLFLNHILVLDFINGKVSLID